MEGFGFLAVALAAVGFMGIFGIVSIRDDVWLDKLEECGMHRVYLIDTDTGSRIWTIELKDK